MWFSIQVVSIRIKRRGAYSYFVWRYNTATNASVSFNTNYNNDCDCVGELMKSRVVCERVLGHACQVGWAKPNRFEKKLA